MSLAYWIGYVFGFGLGLWLIYKAVKWIVKFLIKQYKKIKEKR